MKPIKRVAVPASKWQGYSVAIGKSNQLCRVFKTKPANEATKPESRIDSWGSNNILNISMGNSKMNANTKQNSSKQLSEE